MIKVVGTGELPDVVRQLVHSVNFSEVVLPFSAITDDQLIAVATPATLFGGISVDRSVFRKLLPDARWWVYAAGFAQTSDANTLTIRLEYQKDDTTRVVLGSTTHTGGFTKKTLGPFDVFATAGVPAGETVPIIRLSGQKATAGTATLACWVIWLRLLPPLQ